MGDHSINEATHRHAVTTNAGHHGAIVRLTDENAALRARVTELEATVDRLRRLLVRPA